MAFRQCHEFQIKNICSYTNSFFLENYDNWCWIWFCSALYWFFYLYLTCYAKIDVWAVSVLKIVTKRLAGDFMWITFVWIVGQYSQFSLIKMLHRWQSVISAAWNCQGQGSCPQEGKRTTKTFKWSFTFFSTIFACAQRNDK